MTLQTLFLLQLTALVALSSCGGDKKNNSSSTSNSIHSADDEEKVLTSITSEQQFDSFIKETSKVSVIKLDAPWCSACKYLHPLLVDAAKKGTEFAFARVNIDELPQIGQHYKIVGIPTLLFFKDGQELAESRLVGPEATTGDELLTQIRAAVKNVPTTAAPAAPHTEVVEQNAPTVN